MLLMREGFEDNAQRTKADSVEVAAGSVGVIDVKQGQLLRITALGDGVVASLFGFSLDTPDEWLSVHHTRVFSNSYLLGSGMRMVNNRRRPVMVLGKDTVKHHDLLLPGSTTAWLEKNGYKGPGCMDAVQAELGRLGMEVKKIPDPINLFMHVDLTREGKIHPKPNLTKKGDSVTCRVVINTRFMVSTCCTGIEGNDKSAPLKIEVSESLTDFATQ